MIKEGGRRMRPKRYVVKRVKNLGYIETEYHRKEEN